LVPVGEEVQGVEFVRVMACRQSAGESVWSMTVIAGNCYYLCQSNPVQPE